MDDGDYTSAVANNLFELERSCSFKILDARDAATAYLKAYVQKKDKEGRLADSIEMAKEVENQFHQIVSRISHWRRKMEYLLDLKKYGWLLKEEEYELEDLIINGVDWEYHNVISTRVGPMQKRLAHLMKKKSDKKALRKYEQAELNFLRSLGMDSIEFKEVTSREEHLKRDDETKTESCPAGGRLGYDVDSFDECSDCNVRVHCLQRAEKIDEEFKSTM